MRRAYRAELVVRPFCVALRNVCAIAATIVKTTHNAAGASRRSALFSHPVVPRPTATWCSHHRTSGTLGEFRSSHSKRGVKPRFLMIPMMGPHTHTLIYLGPILARVPYLR